MHKHALSRWEHDHDFTFILEKGELRTKQVLVITVITMAVEVVAGTVFGSMALLADGWHMGTHAGAFAITIFAYHYSKKHANNSDFTFGTGKVSVLGGYSSAIALAVIALFIGIESVVRLITPQQIRFNEAIAVAVLGLIVNLSCAFLLRGPNTHSHEHGHTHVHHHDHNLRGAYLHVLADALTSVLAIFALSLGKIFGWQWLDPLMGIVGALVITRWSYGLLKDTSTILLDRNNDRKHIELIRSTIESDSDNRVSDIHIWKVGPIDYAAIIALVTRYPQPAERYKALLKDFKELSHLTVEVNSCADLPCMTAETRY